MAKVDEPAPSASAVQQSEELTAAAESRAQLAVSPELVAGSVPEYLRASLSRIRAGQVGILPVVGGLLLVSVLFQSLNSHFLTAGNLVNLLVQAAVFSVLAMGVIFALLLGEIDLSIGFVAGLGGVVLAELLKPSGLDWPWWAAILVALLVCAAIGVLQGSIITRLGLPSFVVTLAGLLFWEGVLLKILGNGGSVLISDRIVNDIASGNLSPIAGWVVMLVIVGFFGVLTWRRDARRRRAGLVAPPPGLTALKIGGSLLGGVVIVLICNTDRGRILPIQGVPWVVVLVFVILAAWTFVLGRTRFGRYLYAIGGNAEAARRAGVNLAMIRTVAFTLCSFTAGLAGVIYASRLRSISTAFDQTLVLYAIAAAVIGGTALAGGSGTVIGALIGMFVLAVLQNGFNLIGISANPFFLIQGAAILISMIANQYLSRLRRAGGS